MNLFDANRRAATLAVTTLVGFGALAAALPQTAGAQTGAAKPPTAPGAPGKPGGMMADPAARAKMMAAQKKMVDELHITPDQQTKLQKAQMDFRPKMMAVYNNKSLTDDQKKKQMMDLGVKYRAQMNAIFTPEQQAKIKTMQQQMMQQRMKQMQASGMTPGMAKGAPAKPAH